MCYQLQGVHPRYIPEHTRWDPYFIKILREELDSPNLDIIFDVRSERHGLGVPSDREHYSYYPGLKGCWLVVHWHPTYDRVDLPDDGASISFTSDVPHVVFVCNGDRERPLMPGPWLIDVMRSRDRLVHGFVELEKRADDVTERSAMMKHKAGQAVTRKWREDKSLYRLLRKRGQELTGVNSDKLEILAAERAADKKLEQNEERAKERAKNDTLWQNQRPRTG